MGWNIDIVCQAMCQTMDVGIYMYGPINGFEFEVYYETRYPSCCCYLLPLEDLPDNRVKKNTGRLYHIIKRLKWPNFTKEK